MKKYETKQEEFVAYTEKKLSEFAPKYTTETKVYFDDFDNSILIEYKKIGSDEPEFITVKDALNKTRSFAFKEFKYLFSPRRVKRYGTKGRPKKATEPFCVRCEPKNIDLVRSFIKENNL